MRVKIVIFVGGWGLVEKKGVNRIAPDNTLSLRFYTIIKRIEEKIHNILCKSRLEGVNRHYFFFFLAFIVTGDRATAVGYGLTLTTASRMAESYFPCAP